MKILTVTQAASMLVMHEVTLKNKARSGEIPGSKVGNKWLFIDDDLAEYIRSKYHATRQTDKPTLEVNVCSINAKTPKIGLSKSSLMEKQYTEVLAQATARKRKPSS